MFSKKFVIVSLVNSFPLYLATGKAPLFDNFQITGVDFHFSMAISNAIRVNSEVEGEVWIGGLLYVHPRYAPLTIIPVYDLAIEIMVEGGKGVTVE